MASIFTIFSASRTLFAIIQGEPLTLTVERAEKTVQLPFDPGYPEIASVFNDSPADRAGLKPGDKIIAVDGRKMTSTLAISNYISTHAAQPVSFTYERGGAQRTVKCEATGPGR